MKYKIKVIGKGIMVRGILFSPNRYDGLYVVDEELGKYLLSTFPKEFVLIEKIKDTTKNSKKELLRKERETTSELHTKSQTRKRKAKSKKENS